MKPLWQLCFQPVRTGAGPSLAGSAARKVALFAMGPVTDSLYWIYAQYANWVVSLSPGTFFSFVRCAIVLILATTFCGISYSCFAGQLSRGFILPVHWVLFLISFLTAMEVPFAPSIADTPVLAAGLFALSVAALIILPWQLSFLLVPTAGPRKVAAALIYFALLVLFMARPGI